MGSGYQVQSWADQAPQQKLIKNKSIRIIPIESKWERTFSLSKRCYGMSCITTKLEETQLTSIALSVFVTNLFRIQRRILCALLHLFRFWHDRNRCKSWKLQIAA